MNELQLSKRVIKAINKERLEEARGAGPGLCVDLSMTDCLSAKVRFTKQTLQSGRLIPDPAFLISKVRFLFIHTLFFSQEISRLACQIRRLYGCNKKALQPFRIFLTELKEDSLLHKECVRMNDGFLNYLVSLLFTLKPLIVKAES